MSTQKSVLCLGKAEQDPGAACANWTRQIEDLKRYPSYQDAVGLVGEPIEFEWKNFPILNSIDHSQGDPEGLGKKENRARELQRLDHLYVHVQ